MTLFIDILVSFKRPWFK